MVFLKLDPSHAGTSAKTGNCSNEKRNFGKMAQGRPSWLKVHEAPKSRRRSHRLIGSQKRDRRIAYYARRPYSLPTIENELLGLSILVLARKSSAQWVVEGDIGGCFDNISHAWMVYSKPPFGGPEHVLKYLARYTHRVAISNGRLLSLENDQVSFRWRDSRHNNRSGVMTLDATEFIRRFLLLHVLPAGFVKIRHFGLLANRNRRQALALCRIHLHATLPDNNTLLTEPHKSALNRSCPQCKRGTLHVVPQHFSGRPDRSNSLPARTHFDSS